jgi:hypothetical protein
MRYNFGLIEMTTVDSTVVCSSNDRSNFVREVKGLQRTGRLDVNPVDFDKQLRDAVSLAYHRARLYGVGDQRICSVTLVVCCVRSDYF